MGEKVAPKVRPELRDAVRQLDALKSQEVPLEREVLLAYHLGEVSEHEAEAIRERIVWDDLALAYLESLRNPDKTREVQRSEVDVVADWDALAGLIASETGTSLEDKPRRPEAAGDEGVAGAPRRPSRLRWPRPLLPYQLLAAGLSCVSLGLWWQLDQAQHRIAAYVAPHANLTVVDLIPARDQNSTREPMADFELPWAQTSETLVLLLTYTDFQPFDSYRADLLWGNSGTLDLLHQFEDLERAEDGSFPMVLHREGTPPGDYELRLFGVSDGVESSLASYQFSVTFE